MNDLKGLKSYRLSKFEWLFLGFATFENEILYKVKNDLKFFFFLNFFFLKETFK